MIDFHPASEHGLDSKSGPAMGFINYFRWSGLATGFVGSNPTYLASHVLGANPR